MLLLAWDVVDGASIFQGAHTSIIKQLHDCWSPQLIGIHCFVSFPTSFK